MYFTPLFSEWIVCCARRHRCLLCLFWRSPVDLCAQCSTHGSVCGVMYVLQGVMVYLFLFENFFFFFNNHWCPFPALLLPGTCAQESVLWPYDRHSFSGVVSCTWMLPSPPSCFLQWRHGCPIFPLLAFFVLQKLWDMTLWAGFATISKGK